MLYLNGAPDIRQLLNAFAEVIREPLDDPMATEWVAVPSAGMRRWASLELSRVLGAAPGRHDGIAANISFSFPGALRKLVLNAAIEGEPAIVDDPWDIERLVWTVLEVLEESEIDFMPALAQGATAYGRARRIADLFDRYALHRPDLISVWASGQIEDRRRIRVPRDLVWQALLWQQVRAHIAVASPPERLRARLDLLRERRFELELPPRIAIFGVTSLPGGEGFLDLIDALSTTRDVYCYFLEPSPKGALRVRDALSQRAEALLEDRNDDQGPEVVFHPLLASWATPVREREMLLSSHGKSWFTLPEHHGGNESVVDGSSSLLSRIQHDIRLDRAPSGDLEITPEDRSIALHACHGAARQAEVMRDAILHLLADDPFLREEDIVVLCPSLRDMAPHVEAAFGATTPDVPSQSVERTREYPAAISRRAPSFRYQLADRSLRTSNAYVEAFDALLGLAEGRCTASQVLEFLALAPVRRRFGFDEEEMDKVALWATIAHVRWGLSARHRQAAGFEEGFALNTWGQAIMSLLMGAAVRDVPLAIAASDIAPIAVEGDDLDLAGRLADVIFRLDALAGDFKRPRTPQRWCDALISLCFEFLEPDETRAWEREALLELLAHIGDASNATGREVTTELALGEMRRVVDERLENTAGRASFFRGGVTVSSLTPLRWIPFKVVCILGLDEGLSEESDGVGDDLIAFAPRIGDPDQRSETRQALLEAVLAAEEKFIVTFNAVDPRTNLKVPRSIECTELRDTIVDTIAPSVLDSWSACSEITHPRHAYDDRNFEPGRLGHESAWSFDHVSLRGARARRLQPPNPAPFLERPREVADSVGSEYAIDEVRAFLIHPVRYFLRRSLQIFRPFDRERASNDLPIAISGIERAAIGRRLLEARLEVPNVSDWEHLCDRWWAHERSTGALPVGVFTDKVREDLEGEVDAMMVKLLEYGIDSSPRSRRTEAVQVDIAVHSASTEPSARRASIVGLLDVAYFRDDSGSDWQGTWSASYARAKGVDALSAWLDVLLLTYCQPEVQWKSVSLRRAADGTGIETFDVSIRGKDRDTRMSHAREGLGVVLDCAIRGGREPLPLFSNLSRQLYLEVARDAHWRSGGGGVFADGHDRDNILVFGECSLSELLAIPARSSDPGTGASRAQRFADYLWGCFDRTTGDAAVIHIDAASVAEQDL